MPDDPTPDPTPPAPAPPTPPPPDEPLGEPGQRALAAERTARAAAERDAKAARDALEKLQRDHMSDSEKAIAAARDEGRAEATTAGQKRLVEAEVRAAAAGRLADPADAIRLLDLDGFKVDAAGGVDLAAITKAIDALLKAKQYLAKDPIRTNGSGDGGARTPIAAGLDMNTLIRRGAGYSS